MLSSIMFSSLVLLATLGLGASAAYHCLPGDPCFPSFPVFAAFNASISGKLHSERPIGAVCYPTDPLYNATACSEVTSKYGNDQWRSDSFASYEQINWETCGVKDSCLLPVSNDVPATCGQGSVPLYAVHATSSSDVEKYVQFATKYNLRIVIKNTGHDYTGRSSGQHGFALWTHGLQGISRNQAFVPNNCSIAPQDSISLESGVQWETAYKFADEEGVIIVGGDSNQVGAGGGWLLGGGHSILSPTYGLGVDNLLEVDIVTADGKLHTISECSDPDLFWAVRGGGAGTWGVLTKATYKAHEAAPINAVFLASNSSTSDANAEMVGHLAAISPRLSDLGVGGFLSVFPTQLSYFGIIPGGNMSDLQAAIKPFADRLPDGSVTYTTFPTFFQFFAATYAISNEIVGIPFALSSRLIPRHYFESDSQGLAQAIREGQIASGPEANTQFIQILIDSPAPSFNVGKTSVTPAWYSSLWHVIYTGTWNTTTSAAVQRSEIQMLHAAANVLREYAPDGGAYPNEADIFEPNHEQSFWGSNTERLKAIKKRIDPQNVFAVWQGIGWEGTQDPKYACYAELNPGI